MEEKVSEELRLKREIDQMRKDIELLQVALVLQAKQTEFEIPNTIGILGCKDRISKRRRKVDSWEKRSNCSPRTIS